MRFKKIGQRPNLESLFLSARCGLEKDRPTEWTWKAMYRETLRLC